MLPPTSTKQFYCRTCKRTEQTEDLMVPEGWYSVHRSWRSARTGFARLGLFCSLECLLESLTNPGEISAHPTLAGAR